MGDPNLLPRPQKGHLEAVSGRQPTKKGSVQSQITDCKVGVADDGPHRSGSTKNHSQDSGYHPALKLAQCLEIAETQSWSPGVPSDSPDDG